MYIDTFTISPINNKLEILLEIPKNYYYKNITFKKVAIQDSLHYTELYPENPQLELSPTAIIDDFKIDKNSKLIGKSLCLLDLNKLNIDTTRPLYIYILTDGIPNDDGSCLCFRDLTVSLTINWHIFFALAIKLFIDSNECKNNKDRLVDIYLKKQLIRDAIKYKEFNIINKFWEEIMLNDMKLTNCLTGCYKPISNTTNCNCK